MTLRLSIFDPSDEDGTCSVEMAAAVDLSREFLKETRTTAKLNQ